MKTKLESAVIVHNELGSVATVRFDNPTKDFIISVTFTNSINRENNPIYNMVTKNVRRALDV